LASTAAPFAAPPTVAASMICVWSASAVSTFTICVTSALSLAASPVPFPEPFSASFSASGSTAGRGPAGGPMTGDGGCADDAAARISSRRLR
jgi:hypothetical protein